MARLLAKWKGQVGVSVLVGTAVTILLAAWGSYQASSARADARIQTVADTVSDLRVKESDDIGTVKTDLAKMNGKLDALLTALRVPYPGGQSIK